MMVCIKCILAYMETKQKGKTKEVSKAEEKEGLWLEGVGKGKRERSKGEWARSKLDCACLGDHKEVHEFAQLALIIIMTSVWQTLVHRG